MFLATLMTVIRNSDTGTLRSDIAAVPRVAFNWPFNLKTEWHDM